MLVNNVAKTFNIMTANFSGPIRMDKMAGRDCVVVPMVMMKAGVLTGSQGPVLYTDEEIAKFPAAWNSRPVVVYHPTLNGKGISACDPDVITKQGIGTIMNTRWEDNKLKAEAWCEVDRMDAVDDRVAKAVENNKMMEVSTGLFIEAEKTPGEFNGVKYDAIARNFQPDHLAVLPDLKGACSIEDGAGFIRNQSSSVVIEDESLTEEQLKYVTENKETVLHSVLTFIENELSHDNIRSLLHSALRAETNDDELWIQDVYDSFFIYEKDGKLYKREFTVADNQVSLTGTAVEVVRITEFRTLDGKFVGNGKDKTMNKKQLVDSLIANASLSWSESDRDALMSMNEEVLKKMAPVVKNEGDDTAAAAPAAAAPAAAAPAAAAAAAAPAAPAAAAPAAEPTGNETTEEYLKKAPPEIRGMLTNALKIQDSMKTDLISKITANERNTFTEAFLKTKDVEELQNLAALAGPVENANEHQPVLRFNYSGQAPAGGTPKTAGKALEIIPVAC